MMHGSTNIKHEASVHNMREWVQLYLS